MGWLLHPEDTGGSHDAGIMGDPINLMSWVEILYNHFDVICNSFLGRKHGEILYLVKKSDAKRQRRVGCFCWLAWHVFSLALGWDGVSE